MSQINTILDTFLHKRQIPHLIFHGRNHSKKIEIVNNFLNKVYYFDLKMKKDNVYSVDCCYSKGIKFIRDDLKLFAKSNVSNNRNGFAFKTTFSTRYLTVVSTGLHSIYVRSILCWEKLRNFQMNEHNFRTHVQFILETNSIMMHSWNKCRKNNQIMLG